MIKVTNTQKYMTAATLKWPQKKKKKKRKSVTLTNLTENYSLANEKNMTLTI